MLWLSIDSAPQSQCHLVSLYLLRTMIACCWQKYATYLGASRCKPPIGWIDVVSRRSSFSLTSRFPIVLIAISLNPGHCTVSGAQHPTWITYLSVSPIVYCVEASLDIDFGGWSPASVFFFHPSFSNPQLYFSFSTDLEDRVLVLHVDIKPFFEFP